MPANSYHYEFMSQIIDMLKSHGKNVACLFLSYDLAPAAQYPRQLQQASVLLTHVLQDLHIPPQNILLTGDSAGANLVLSLLSHISHPHPSTSVPIPPIKLDTPLCGAVLISPWVSFSLSDPSFTTNMYKDLLDPITAKKWSSAFLGELWPHKEKSDFYSQAITAPEDWWKDLMAENVLIVAGEEEVLLDGIRNFEEKLRRGMSGGDGERGRERVEFLVAKGEYHDQPTLDLQLGYQEKDEGEQARRIKGWISSKL
jgi:acetyl esterase/lipase